ncbi:MAG TPA: hypothetical protein VH458_22320 [Vicinamibacterales bacterium]
MGVVSPEYGTMVRRGYFATPITLYAAVALRLVMGLVVILAAPSSRASGTIRALGAVMCLQALTATVLGPDHARAVMEWETMQGAALLRVGAALALAAGGFMVFALTGARPKGAQPTTSRR